MSRSISILFFLLIVLIAGFAYVNYNRLNQIQDELLEKQGLLEDSEQVIEEQRTSIAQLEERFKETLATAEISPEQELIRDRENEFQEQLTGYQLELQEMRQKLEQAIQQSTVEPQDIVQLREEKSKLETLLKEKEEQWQTREEENQEMIALLQGEIQKYETDMNSVNEKILNFEKNLESEVLKRNDLEQSMIEYEENIASLREKLALEQDDESRVQEISQLQIYKDQLEEEIKERDSLLGQIQGEYQSLKHQLTEYEQKIASLQEDLVTMKEQEGVLGEMQVSLVQLREEKSKLEHLLLERESQWLDREQESQEKIVQLQEEVQQYEANLKQIGGDMLSLREDLIQESSFKERLQKEVTHFSTEINSLKQELAYYQEMEHSYQSLLSELQSDKETLERKLSEKGSEVTQQEYQDLISQLNAYQKQMQELKEELALAKEKEDALIASQFAQIKEEKKALERMLAEKDDEWSRQNQENRDLISHLKSQLEGYQEEVEVIKVDSSLLKEEIAAQVELQQEMVEQIREREEQISMLIAKIEQYAEKMDDYETTVNLLRTTLQQQEDLSYHEQEDLIERLISLVTERDSAQHNINQYRTQVDKLQSEIIELQNKIAALEKEKESQYYEVKSGDCLWTIAKNKYNEGIAWTKIFKANQGLIENPDLIYPYQQIVLPE